MIVPLSVVLGIDPSVYSQLSPSCLGLSSLLAGGSRVTTDVVVVGSVVVSVVDVVMVLAGDSVVVSVEGEVVVLVEGVVVVLVEDPVVDPVVVSVD